MTQPLIFCLFGYSRVDLIVEWKILFNTDSISLSHLPLIYKYLYFLPLFPLPFCLLALLIEETPHKLMPKIVRMFYSILYFIPRIFLILVFFRGFLPYFLWRICFLSRFPFFLAPSPFCTITRTFFPPISTQEGIILCSLFPVFVWFTVFWVGWVEKV